MIKRGIKNVQADIKARVVYDKDFFIKATPFKVNTKMIKCDSFKLVIDETDGNESVNCEISQSRTYYRKNYVSCDISLFNIINDLTKKEYALFKYIIGALDIGANHVLLTTDKIGFIINSDCQPLISRTLTGLIKKGIIDKSTEKNSKDIYVINHNLIFKGNYNKFIFRYNKLFKDDINSNIIEEIEDDNNINTI